MVPVDFKFPLAVSSIFRFCGTEVLLTCLAMWRQRGRCPRFCLSPNIRTSCMIFKLRALALFILSLSSSASFFRRL